MAALLALTIPTLTNAQSFIDQSAALPAPHVYSGGWEHFVGGGVAVFDCNADTRPDIFAAGGEGPSHLFRNDITDGNWAFSDVSFPVVSRVTGAYPIEIDGDGIIDLFILRVGGNKIYRGLGDCRFEAANGTLGFQSADRWSTAFSATWQRGEALPTLAVGNYVDRSDPEGPFGACDINELYLPNGTVYDAPISLTAGYCALSILFSDWSRTGHIDLRLSNDRHYYVRDGHEQMYRLDENRFLTPTDNWQNISIWGMGIASQDITGDSYPDVVLTSMGDQLLQYGGNAGFTAAPHSIGTYAQRPHTGVDGRPSTGWHAEFGDMDNDGREDLFIAKGNVDQMPGLAMKDPNNLLMQQVGGTFHEAAGLAGVDTQERSRGAALTDLNGDGRLDIVVVNRRAPMEIHQNTTAAGNWVKLTPRQIGMNSFAIGSWIEIQNKDGSVRTKEITTGGGHAGGKLGPVHYGLGAQDSVNMRVLWPDGSKSDWTSIKANQSVSLWKAGNGQLKITAQ